ncbi:MAG: tRNA (adenosine(37)-N6)-threonylcarbamoyltransferase complex dimerization subunit type 1 TsaB [Quinella sp. 3Q1]|nr:tRNA (adenosine(37)-N6)-threonylcarbamoyltransferase complex dimerization subunit type 1 TsaB [Quinella sp. 3Q1]MBR3051404.1 tRNA (adenosine(37)-N6)-threonylcarbamoyltransferase complex dimerization subunit type 1 TsaB [Selenomonadaceae bacterium]MBR6887451.1 tRNA (adenosine(37)-N6)-threonylcarbamoyltransferase complex dimerization subunit type 1 TsaB [Selenomonadaceae bacterium]
MRILAIETATRAASVAVTFDGKILAESVRESPQSFSETLMPQVEEVIKVSGAFENLDAVAVSIGPGSFTGLRIGLATAKALAYAWGIKIIGVPTLLAMSYNFPNAKVVPLIDAQKNRAYYQLFEDSLSLTDLEIKPIDEIVNSVGHVAGEFFLCGDVLHKIKIPLPPNVRLAPPHLRMPRASAVAWCAEELGRVDNVMNLEPLYIRRSEAEELWEKRHGSLSEQ